jgi:two-component SAPR family response regulator
VPPFFVTERICAVVQSTLPAKRRVVIIDDDSAFAGVLSKMVESLGHEAISKLDARISDTFEVRDSDVVFIDILMPHVNGIQVLEQFDRQNVKSAIVLMSGYDQFLDVAVQVAKKLDIQLSGVLHKPIRLVDVQTILEAA